MMPCGCFLKACFMARFLFFCFLLSPREEFFHFIYQTAEHILLEAHRTAQISFFVIGQNVDGRRKHLCPRTIGDGWLSRELGVFGRKDFGTRQGGIRGILIFSFPLLFLIHNGSLSYQISKPQVVLPLV